MKVAIQGVAGAFHEVAAKNYFENNLVEPIACSTFKQLAKIIEEEKAEVGVMAIENTIAGSLLPNYELLRKHELKIVGEHKLRIEHCLASLPNESIEQITEINSHPIALMQCYDFLENYPLIKLVEKDDTANSAKQIAENNLKGHAAICSRAAAELYNLKVLFEGIETNKHNFTRFLVITTTSSTSFQKKNASCNKASLQFALPHKEGSLSQVLSIISFYGVNLTKIQSLPIIGHEWEYMFYIDITFDSIERYNQTVTAITPLTSNLREMGKYEACI